MSIGCSQQVLYTYLTPALSYLHFSINFLRIQIDSGEKKIYIKKSFLFGLMQAGSLLNTNKDLDLV